MLFFALECWYTCRLWARKRVTRMESCRLFSIWDVALHVSCVGLCSLIKAREVLGAPSEQYETIG